MLKTSARNCNFTLSVMVVVLNSDRSKSEKPGPLSAPRGTFPHVPDAGEMKAFGLYHWFGLPRINCPVKAGFHDGRSGFERSPFPETLEDSWGVMGKPLNMLATQ